MHANKVLYQLRHTLRPIDLVVSPDIRGEGVTSLPHPNLAIANMISASMELPTLGMSGLWGLLHLYPSLLLVLLSLSEAL